LIESTSNVNVIADSLTRFRSLGRERDPRGEEAEAITHWEKETPLKRASF
jgi:hypothetical protein